MSNNARTNLAYSTQNLKLKHLLRKNKNATR